MSGSVKSKPFGRFGAAIYVLLTRVTTRVLPGISGRWVGLRRFLYYLRAMDDGVAAFMRIANDGFPAVETMTPPQARAVLVGRRVPVMNLDDVASADDRVLPGPDGDIPVRIYRPHGDGDSRPAVVFAHG